MNESKPTQETPRYLLPIEQQADSHELPSICLFNRLNNLDIRKQLLDFLYNQDQARAGETIKKVQLSDDGKPLRDLRNRFIIESTTYVPKPYEEISRRFEKEMGEAQTITNFSRGANEPNLNNLPLEWKMPGEKNLHPKQWGIIEAHEKGHLVRPYYGKYSASIFSKAFDRNAVTYTFDDYLMEYPNRDVTYEDATENFYRYLFSPNELAERMSQLKNYFGMTADEKFTKEHLAYAREHYIKDTDLDNRMTHFFQAITPEKEDAFIELINSAGI